MAAAATGYGLAACLFTGTTWMPVAYTGAFLWGAAGSVLGAVAVTTLQEVTPIHAHGRIMSISATLQSWTETIGLPLGGVTWPPSASAPERWPWPGSPLLPD